MKKKSFILSQSSRAFITCSGGIIALILWCAYGWQSKLIVHHNIENAKKSGRKEGSIIYAVYSSIAESLLQDSAS